MTYQMKAREIPLYDGYDVIVAGGGPAGIAAAVSAAREGAKTLLIEATGALGGMSTMGLVPAWCPYSDKEKIIYRGLAERILNAGKAQTPFVDPALLNWVPINPEAMKVIFDDLCCEFGVEVLFGTVLCDAESEDGEVRALTVVNKAGLSAYKAKVYIDCTGDADLSHFAGAQVLKGVEGDESILQPSTYCFSLGGVNDEAYLRGVRLHGSNKESPIHALKASPDYPLITDTHFCNNKIATGSVGFNAGHLNDVDGTDPRSLSAGYMLGRKKAHEVLRGLKEMHPDAFGNAFVQQTAPLMGVRETRRVVCDYTLTREDYVTRRTFPDEISRNSYYIDIHMTPKEYKLAAGFSGENRAARYGKGESHGIPYRCLTPVGLSNLLVAGRIISCDRDLQGSVRVMPNCFTTGEAAGLAAAICAKSGISTHDVDTDDLRARLREYGAYFL